MITDDELRLVEMRLLLDGVARVYGYDFRDYAEASLRRRNCSKSCCLHLSSFGKWTLFIVPP